MKEKILSLEHEGLTLQGTLSLPEETSQESSKAQACVLMIGGSGPLDRNQNSGKLQLNLFNTLAAELAEIGVASVRYDKRGCGVSTGNLDSAGHYDLVSDASKWLEFLHTQDDVKDIPIYVLGHAEGSLIAPQLAARHPDIIAGQILLSPFTENYASIIERQVSKALEEVDQLPGVKGNIMRFFLRLGGDQIKKQRKLIESIMKSGKSVMKVRKQKINAKWIREMIALDARDIHASVSIPTLAIGGSKDLQSSPDDIQVLKRIIKGPLKAHVIPDLTHILRADPAEPTTRHYARLSELPVDERLLDFVSRWLRKQISS